MAAPEQRQTAALVEAGMILSSELDLEVLLQRIANLARDVLGAKYAAVGVLKPEGGGLSRFVYSGIDKETADRIGDLPTGKGVLGVLTEEGRPLRLPEISHHARSYGFPKHHPPMHTFLGVPIRVRDKVFGRLYLTEKQGRTEFTKDDERIALTFASQAGVAIENARLHDEIANRERDLAVLEERERISKELHDGVIQSIYSVGLSIQGSLSMLERDPEIVQRRLDDAIAELDNVVRNVRSYIFELQPKDEAGRPFEEVIGELVRDFEVNTLAHVSTELDPEVCSSLNSIQVGDLIQIVRETLSNIARHAHCSEVWLSCRERDGHLTLEIADDGVGFDRLAVVMGHGLRNMEDRAQRLGGNLTIEPRDPKGTRHVLTIPLDRGGVSG